MSIRPFTFVSLVVVLALLLSTNGIPVAAQGSQPPQPPGPEFPFTEPGTYSPEGPQFNPGDEVSPESPRRKPGGDWYTPAGTRGPVMAGLTPQATGGPDDFGYTWDDVVAFNWIDASGAADTGLTSNCSNSSKAIPIGFTFKFYENAYTTVYVDLNGYLKFNSGNTCRWHGRLLIPSQPNNVIAPYWGHFNSVAGHVRYLQGGTEPNRYLVVEWYQMTDSDSASSNYTFEAILYENGDILFQYEAMNYSSGYSCSGVGIEDSTGSDGFSYRTCSQIPSNKAIRFYRPAPSARVRVYPLYYGALTRPGENTALQVPIRNTGELGNDTYDLSVLSSAWPVTLYAADGVTPLTDTDSDGSADTGLVAQGNTANITARVLTPGGAVVGDDNTTQIIVRSSLNTGKSKTVTLQTAVPAPFAQVYRDNADGAMSILLAQPAAQAVKKATSNSYYGYDMSVAETPTGNFIYAWGKGRCLDNDCNLYTSEIEYTLLNNVGDTLRGATKLTDNSGATMDTYDWSPVVAVAPNGRVGVLWYRYLYNSNTGQDNYNIYFAILDASGTLTYGPINLTNDNTWGTFSGPTPTVVEYFDPKISATGDNRFVLAWQKYYYGAPTGNCSSYCSVADIYYTVRDTNGGEVRGITQFTNDTVGFDEGYYNLNLANLSGGRALLTWNQGSSDDIHYAVFDSGGNVIMGATNLVGDGAGQYDYVPDAVQLSDGKTVVAWIGNLRIRFAVLDASYNRVAGPTMLTNPAAVTGDNFVSVAADASGRAVLTWMDSTFSNRRNLYYALVDGSGNVLTPPMIFRTSQSSSNPYIETSYEGYGNTSYTVGPQLSLNKTASALTLLPDETFSYIITLSNSGAGSATNVVLSDTLPAGVTLAGPVTLNPPGLGTVGASPNLLSGLALAPGQVVVATVPVRVNSGQPAGALIANTAGLTSAEVPAPLTASAVITVADAPLVARDDFALTAIDTPATIYALGNDGDPNGDPLTLTAVGAPLSGTVSMAGLTLIYTPTLGFLGTDVFTYTVSTAAESDTATVTVRVALQVFQLYLPRIGR